MLCPFYGVNISAVFHNLDKAQAFQTLSSEFLHSYCALIEIIIIIFILF